MSYRTFIKVICRFLINRIFAGVWCFGIKRRLLRAMGYRVGDGTKVVGPFYCSGSLDIGENCWIGKNLTVNGNGRVTIGDNCDIAPEVTFLTGGHGIGDGKRRAGKGETYQIRIGNGVWIGARATIGKSVTVRDSSVVAACACVMKDVDENKLVGGVPARVIKDLDD